MLHDTRFAPYFEFFGDTRRHFGIFKGCGVDLPFSEGTGSAPAPSCC
jgi:hypothetical protein